MIWTEAEVTWWQLSGVEAEALGIDLKLRNALMFAWVHYQDVIGCTDVEFGAFREAARITLEIMRIRKMALPGEISNADARQIKP